MGRNWAIVVGINHYENLRPLKYAKRDALVMTTWFQQEANFERVFLFTDDSPPIAASSPIPTQPTFGHLRRFLRVQFEDIQQPWLKPEDNLWFFFAGHGNRYKDNDYLMCSDSDPGDIEHTAISVNYVTQRLRRIGADNVVLFLDACRNEGSRAGLGIGEQRHQGVITFYSCTANQQSWEIDELQHGSFTYTLLEGLRLQGEVNCATVERLEQYLRSQVPRLNTSYNKLPQDPYLQAEPPYKMYFVLLEQAARLKDVEPLKYQASLAENRGELSLAKQLWVRVLAASRGDWDAVDAIERIALRQRENYEPVIPSIPVSESQSGERLVNSEAAQKSQFAQREEQHQQNLAQYRQSFSQAIEQEFPLGEASRKRLRDLQQSLQLSDEEISQIQQPIIAQKEAECRKQQEAERTRQQQEVERRQREEAEYRQKLQQYEQKLIKTVEAGNSLDNHQVRQMIRQLQIDLRLEDTDIAAIEARVVASRRPVTHPPPIQQPTRAQPSGTTPVRINRKQFLKWAGLGGAGLVTAVVGREIFESQSPTPISVVTKDIPPTEGGGKALGLPLWTAQFEIVTVDEKGQVVKPNSKGQAKFFKEDLGNNVTLEMVEIPAGSFQMGSPPGEKGGGDSEEPQHPVVNVPTFFMGRFAVTQEQYQQVMGSNPSIFVGAKRPVESVFWNEAVEFCKKLSQKTGRTYRLPSEAEWEYACRAGTTTPFHFGATLTTDLANYDGNYTYASAPKGQYREQTTEVGSFPPNAFGLYDMHGNVWEWCADHWHENYEGAPTDGRAWLDRNNNDNQFRLLRGGSWNYNPEDCRSANRSWYDPDSRDNGIGFRVVCGVAAPRT